MVDGAKEKLDKVKNDDEIEEVVPKLKDKTENTAASAFKTGLKNAIKAVEVALSKSDKDGDKKGHPAAIGEIRAKANQIWNKDITKI